jgi:hypothetical protein
VRTRSAGLIDLAFALFPTRLTARKLDCRALNDIRLTRAKDGRLELVDDMVLLVAERESLGELSVFNVDDLERVNGLWLLKVDEIDVRETVGVRRLKKEAYESRTFE